MTRCGSCEQLGHNRRTCERVAYRGKAKGFDSTNAGYAANRAAGLCDGCGAKSKRFAHCKRCRDRRRTMPSKRLEHRRLHERRGSGQRRRS